MTQSPTKLCKQCSKPGKFRKEADVCVACIKDLNRRRHEFIRADKEARKCKHQATQTAKRWYLTIQRNPNVVTCSGCRKRIPSGAKMAWNSRLCTRLCLTCAERAGLTLTPAKRIGKDG